MEGVVQDPAHLNPSNGLHNPGEPKKNPRRRPARQAREITVNQGTSSQGRPPRRQRPRGAVGNSADQETGGTDPTEKVRKPRPQRKPPSADGGNAESVPAPPKRESGRRANFGANLTQPESTQSNPTVSNKPQGERKSPDDDNAEGVPAPPRRDGGRRANFGANLTQPGSSKSRPAVSNTLRGDRQTKSLPGGDDLASSLIRNLSTPPYPDCPICFSAIRPEQAIWSCSPSIPIVTSSEAQVQQYCWTSFHVKCIRSWAEKSVKEVADALQARGETGKRGDWRCPGCQAKREAVPSGYWCVFPSLIAQTYTNSFIGASVTRLLNLNLSVYPHRIHAETRVLVGEKVAADTCVLSNVTPALVHHVKLPPVWNATARRRRFSLSAVGSM